MSKYTLESRPFPALGDLHQGTGNIAGSWVVVKPDSVNQDVKSQLEFTGMPYKIVVMSLEIATQETPNWFGVSFRQGITSFDTVNIFCHPYPTKAMTNENYGTRGGDWPRVFRYAELIGRQIDIANKNHITIVPFFNPASYESTGIFGANWKDIVEQILVHARNAAQGAQVPSGKAKGAYTSIESGEFHDATRKKGSSGPAVDLSGRLQNVVLSDFSHGRVLMWNLLKQASGLKKFLREVWDFDGVHGPAPVAPRAFVYYNLGGGSNGTTSFPVPPERWLNWHHRVISRDDLHGDVPARLATHAATISQVG